MNNGHTAYRTFLWSLLIVVLISLVIVYFGSSCNQSYQKSSLRSMGPLKLYGQLSDFSLIERSTQPIHLNDLKGKVWVCDFIFTRCSGICPMMSKRMADLQKELPQDENLLWVSFSVDPEWDTPQVLDEYAKKYDADPKQWLFLTGERNKIHQLIKEDFKLGVEAGKRMNEPIIHSNRFVLVDGDAQIRGFYQANDKNDLIDLKRDLKALLEL